MRFLYEKYPELKRVEESGQHRLNVRKAVLRHAPRHAVGAEIGVLTGLFSDVLAEEIPSTCIYLVDPWSKLHGSHFPNWGRYTADVSLSTEAAKAAATWRADSADSRCVVVEDFCSDWLNRFKEPFLGWAYLDASHSYQAVFENLISIERCLLPDGTIMGDDMWIGPETGASDVYFAVRAFCRAAGFELVHADQFGQWAIKRTAAMDNRASPTQQKAMD